jgi:putative endonuclease
MGSLSGTLYIGFTGNLHKRIFQHKFHQMEGFTNRYDVELLQYWASYDDVHLAIAREKQLKGWSRAKKIVLIELRNPHWLDLAKDWYPYFHDVLLRSPRQRHGHPAPGPAAASPRLISRRASAQ